MTTEMIYPHRETIEQDGKVFERYVEDLTPHLERAKALREDTDITARKKSDMWHVASIPMSVVIEIMQKHGFNIFQDRDPKKLMSIIKTEYPHLLTM